MVESVWNCVTQSHRISRFTKTLQDYHPSTTSVTPKPYSQKPHPDTSHTLSDMVMRMRWFRTSFSSRKSGRCCETRRKRWDLNRSFVWLKRVWWNVHRDRWDFGLRNEWGALNSPAGTRSSSQGSPLADTALRRAGMWFLQLLPEPCLHWPSYTCL